MIGDFRRSAIGRMLHATLLIGGLGAALAGPAALADSGGNHQPPAVPAQARAQGEALTQEIVDLSQRHRRASGAEKGRLLADLKRAAEARYDLLADLIESNPGEVLRLALPDRLSAGMPAEVRAWLEQRAEIEGELEVLHIDMADAAESRFAYFLETELGERFSLHFAGRAPDWVSGTEVRTGGVLLDGVETQDAAGADGALAVEAGNGGIEVLAAGGTGGAGSGTPASGLTNTFGEKRALAIMVNFQDKPTEQPWTATDVTNVVFGQASDYYYENSYQQTWLTGDIIGWYTIPLNSTVCDYWAIRTYAEQAATSQGVSVSNYDRVVYLFPRNACNWGGLGVVGGSGAWLNGFLTLRLATHEMGHNFGLYHSHSLECGATTISSDCVVWSYGDTLDVMGSSSSAHFNAYQKDRLGWLGFGTSPPLTNAQADGSYAIAPYENAGTSPKALKIQQGIDPVTGLATWYYLEYRQPIGFDGFLSTNDNVRNGVVLHRMTEGDVNSGVLLDTTPASSADSDWNDPALTGGQEFSDASAGITVTTLSADAGGATVSINLGPVTCTPANPTVAVSPSESQWVSAGTPVAFTVTVTNSDSAACPNATFSLTLTLPTGWSGSYDNASLTLAPGASGTRTLTVTSPAATANGFYTVTAIATNASVSAATASVDATYVVSNPVANQPPIAVNDNGGTATGTATTIMVLGNDSDPDGDPLSVTTTTQGTNGSVAINANNTVTYTPDSGFAGTDGFGYTISDGRGSTAGASVSVTVTQPNQPPVAVNDSGATPANTPVTIAVLPNDSDPDGDTLSITAATQGAKGTVTINANGTVTYNPGKGFKGSDSFTYTVSDGRGGTAAATVTVKKSRSRGAGA